MFRPNDSRSNALCAGDVSFSLSEPLSLHVPYFNSRFRVLRAEEWRRGWP